MIISGRNWGLEFSTQARLTLNKFSHQFMYGSREVLLRYANLPQDYFLAGVLQHGVGPGATLQSNYPAPRFVFRRSPVWVASKENESFLKNEGIGRVRAIGSAWSYATALSKRTRTKTSRSEEMRDILYFPAHHTWTLFDGIDNSNPLSRQLRTDNINFLFSKLRRDFPNESITCCVYWVDLFEANWESAAQNYDIKIVSAGRSATDPIWDSCSSRTNFFFNLMSIIQSHRACLVEEYSSAIFYALDLKVPTFVSRYLNHSNGAHIEIQWLKEACPEIFSDFSINTRISSFVDYSLGNQEVLESDAVATQLEWFTTNKF